VSLCNDNDNVMTMMRRRSNVELRAFFSMTPLPRPAAVEKCEDAVDGENVHVGAAQVEFESKT
jgi:hypothetical protein